jgi:hypothetical protein
LIILEHSSLSPGIRNATKVTFYSHITAVFLTQMTTWSGIITA